jgi:chemotaxis signal transduction protein
MDRIELQSAQASKMRERPPEPIGPWFDALECVIGKAHVVVSAARVRSVVELELSAPPPLGRKWVGGLGTHEGRVVVCVSLVRVGALTSRMGKGLLCSVPESEVGWMLEVSSVRSFLKVRKVARPVTAATPVWFCAAQTEEKRLVGYVDVELMVRELAGRA